MDDNYFDYFAYENPMKNKALLADIERMLVYLYKRGCYFCVCMSLYIVHAQCQVWGNARCIAPLVPYKAYKGHHAEPVMTCQSLALEHMSEHGKGTGTGTSRAHLESDAAGNVMGLRCCVGVHSTSRPPQINLCFR